MTDGTRRRLVVILSRLRPAAWIEPWWERNERWARPATTLAAAILVSLLPLWLNVRWEEIMVLVGVFALLSLGLNVVVGFAGLLDLGYVAFWAIGAYTTAIFLGAAPVQIVPWVLPVWVVFPIAMVVGMVGGLILGAPVLRLRGDYLAIVTLGFGEIVRIVANNLDRVTRGPKGIPGIPEPEIPAWAWVHLPNFFITIANGVIRAVNWIWWGGDVERVAKVRDVGDVEFGTDPKPYYYLLVVIILLVVFALRRLNDSRVGRAWIAIREDEDAAEAMGVPTLKMKLLAFAIGAATASFAGVVQATRLGFISPGSFAVIISILILSMVVLGGMGSLAGAIVGAAVIVILPEAFRDLEDYRFLVFGVVLVVMMVFRPQGIIPSRRRAAEMMEAPSEAAATPVPSAAGGGEIGEVQ